MHDVHAEVAGPGHAHEGVHVGAVHVEQGVDAVEDVGDLLDAVLEDADGVRVGDHGAGDLGPDLLNQSQEALAHLAGSGIRHVLEADGAIRLGGQLHHLVARHGRGGRIGAVAAVGDEDDPALAAMGQVVMADEHDARELARSPG